MSFHKSNNPDPYFWILICCFLFYNFIHFFSAFHSLIIKLIRTFFFTFSPNTFYKCDLLLNFLDGRCLYNRFASQNCGELTYHDISRVTLNHETVYNIKKILSKKIVAQVTASSFQSIYMWLKLNRRNRKNFFLKPNQKKKLYQFLLGTNA